MKLFEPSPPKPDRGMHSWPAMPATLTTSPLQSEEAYMDDDAHETASPFALASVVVTAGGMWYFSLSVKRLPTRPYLVKNVRINPLSSL